MEVESRIHLSSRALINWEARSKRERTFLNPLLESRMIIEIQEDYEDDFEEEAVYGFLKDYSYSSDIRCKFKLVSTSTYKPSSRYVFDITGDLEGYSVNGGKKFGGLSGLTLGQVWNEVLFKPRTPLKSYKPKEFADWNLDFPPLPDEACLIVYDRYLLTGPDLKEFIAMVKTAIGDVKKRKLDIWIFVEAQRSQDAMSVAASAVTAINQSSLKGQCDRFRLAIFLISKEYTYFDGAHDRYYIFDTFSFSPGNSLNGKGRTGMLHFYRHVEGQSGSIGTLEILPALKELLKNWQEKTHNRFEAVKFSSPTHEKGMLRDGFTLSVAPSLGMSWDAGSES